MSILSELYENKNIRVLKILKIILGLMVQLLHQKKYLKKCEYGQQEKQYLLQEQ